MVQTTNVASMARARNVVPMAQTEVGQMAQTGVTEKTEMKKENTDEIEFGIMVASETPTDVETAAMAQTKELESMAEITKDAKENETQKQPVNVADTAMTDVKGDGTAEVKAGEAKGDGKKNFSKKNRTNRKHESKDKERRRRRRSEKKPDDSAAAGSKLPEPTAEISKKTAGAAPTADDELKADGEDAKLDVKMESTEKKRETDGQRAKCMNTLPDGTKEQ